MSSSPLDPTTQSASMGALISLTATADSMVEISVIDGYFRRVAKGLGRCVTEQPPGLYKVKFDAGSVVSEVHLTLEPGEPPVTIAAPELTLYSAAPLAGAGAATEAHRSIASDESRKVHLVRGTGSHLFVFVRDLLGSSPDGAATGLSLHDIAGKQLVDFTQDGARGYQLDYQNPWAACNVQLAPGTYRLRSAAPGRKALEQSVVASSGWQTQVFLLRKPLAKSKAVRRPHLFSASIQMGRPLDGFNPDEQYLRWGEMARQALASNRPVMSEQEMRNLLPQLLSGKFANPMFGIYGLHLLLLRPQLDHGLATEVVRNLRALLGLHPDVESIALWLGPNAVSVPPPPPGFSFPAPPMLLGSWRRLVEASVSDANLVLPDSLTARAAANLWGIGPWLVWREPLPIRKRGKRSAQGPPDPSALDRLLSEIASKVQDGGTEMSLSMIAEKAGLNPLESEVLGFVSSQFRSHNFKHDFYSSSTAHQNTANGSNAASSELTTPMPPVEDKALIRALGVPKAVVAAAVSELAHKLGLS